MEILDVKGSLAFSPDRHVYRFLAETPLSSISLLQRAQEVQHVLRGYILKSEESGPLVLAFEGRYCVVLPSPPRGRARGAMRPRLYR